jgi:hypothetical protein
MKKILILVMVLLSISLNAQMNSWFFVDNSALPLIDSVLVIQICNSNAAIDDNFDIYLNGTYIGFVDLNQHAEIGSLFSATSKEDYLLDPDFTCDLIDMQNYFFNYGLLLYGTNTIFMDNVQNNGNNNFGSIGIRTYSISGDSLVNPRNVADLSFSGASGGEDFTKEFEY